MHNARCAFRTRPKLMCDFGMATIGGNKRDFPSRVLSTCRTGGDGKAVLVIGKFSHLDEPTAMRSPFLRNFSLGASPKVPCVGAPTFYKARRDFSHDHVKQRAGSKLKCDNDRLRKVLVTKGAFSCPFVRKGTVRTTKKCSFMSYDSRTIRGNFIQLTSCPVASLVFKTSEHPFSRALRRLLAACYRKNNGLVLDNSCVKDGVGDPATLGFARGVLGCDFKNDVVGSASKRVCKTGAHFDVPHAVGRRACTMPTPSYLAPVTPTCSTFMCGPNDCDTNITCGNGCQAFILNFPFRDVRKIGRETQMVDTVLNFFNDG